MNRTIRGPSLVMRDHPHDHYHELSSTSAGCDGVVCCKHGLLGLECPDAAIADTGHAGSEEGVELEWHLLHARGTVTG